MGILIRFRLHQMHEMLTILTDVGGVCVCLSVSLSVCLSRGLNRRRRRVQCTPRAVCAGSFGAAFVKLLWPLVFLHVMSRSQLIINMNSKLTMLVVYYRMVDAYPILEDGWAWSWSRPKVDGVYSSSSADDRLVLCELLIKYKKLSYRWQTVRRLCTPMFYAVKSCLLVIDCDLLARFFDLFLPLSHLTPSIPSNYWVHM